MLPRILSPYASLLSRRWLRPALSALGLSLGLTLGCTEAADDSGVSQGGSGANPPGSGGSNASGSGGVSGAGATSGSSGMTSTGGTANAGTGGTSSGGSGNAGGGGTSAGAGASSGGAGAGGAATGGSAGGAGMGGSAASAGSAGMAASGSGGAAGGSGGATKSAGCGKARTLQDGNRSVQSGGAQRTYVLRVPTDYDNTRPYRLILGFHGANGRGADVAPSYFGLWNLSQGSTIFAALDAVDGLWRAGPDTTMVTDLLQQLKDDLCIDTSHIGIEGFSQGGAMVWTLACGLPGTFRYAIVHSGGGLPMPQTCQKIPFFSALGDDGSGQDMSSDFFAMTNGCTVQELPLAPTGGHACTNYMGCDAGFPTRWCDYDGGHTAAHVDSGQNMSWVPQEVWNFIEQF